MFESQPLLAPSVVMWMSCFTEEKCSLPGSMCVRTGVTAYTTGRSMPYHCLEPIKFMPHNIPSEKLARNMQPRSKRQ